MWKQQNRVLTAGTLVVRKDYRMRLKDDFSLELTQLKPDDQGSYTCEIDVMGKPISIKHKVSCMIEEPLVEFATRHNGRRVGGLSICDLLILHSRHFWNHSGHFLEHIYVDIYLWNHLYCQKN